MSIYIQVFPRRCMGTGKGMHDGFLAWDTEVYSTEQALAKRLQEDIIDDGGFPMTDEYLLDEFRAEYTYTTFPYDDVDDDGNPVAYTADGQVVKLNDIKIWQVRYPLEPKPHEKKEDKG